MWWVTVAFGAGPVEPPSASVPAAGRHDVVFDLARFGRYAVSVKSAQGASVQVIDPMAGPGPRFGEAGRADGRVDLFEDRGKIKVVVQGDPQASGNATVSVAPYADLDPTAPQLVPEKRVSTTLKDLGQRSYWVDLGQAQAFTVDVAARYLGDVRLWRDGSWLVDAQPECRAITPKAGQPWRRCVLSTSLEPGLYLLTVYGGPADAWAQSSTAEPMTLQWGATPLSTAGRLQGVIGASGYDLYQVGRDTDQAWIALPDNAPASLSWGYDPFGAAQTAEITKESRRPTASVSPAISDNRKYVVVRGAPGQPYSLAWFPTRSPRLTSGTWYYTTISAADPADVPEPTAVVYRVTPKGEAIRSVAQGLPIDGSHRISRQFNLPSQTTLLLDVTEAASYRISLQGGSATFRPFLVGKPLPFKPVGSSTDLDAGLYELQLTPTAPGIATLEIVEDSLFGQAKRALGGSTPLASVRPEVQFPSLSIEADLQLLLEPRPGVATGQVFRSLPIDPRDPLPVTLLPGEALSIPVVVREVGTLSARASDGQPVLLSVDGGGWANSVHVDAASAVQVRNDRGKPVTLSLQLLPDRLAPDRPLPALDAARLAGLPKFPTVSASAPAALDLESGRTATYSLAVDAHGLYRIESTGLLATHGSLRTRVTTDLAQGDANGVGRNFLIGGYFRAGDYQLTVGTDGASEGHLGIRLTKSPLLDGGDLPLAAEGRATLPPDAAIRYRFEVKEAGTYQIEHRGPSGAFRCRVEDADGFPVVRPDQTCLLRVELVPGTYSVVGAPGDVTTRRITVVTRLQGAPPEPQGHGPFALAIGRPAHHVWVEPKDGEERAPDVWTVALAAPVRATIELSAEMAAELRVGTEIVGKVVPGAGWTGELPAGELRIEVRGARQGTGVPYRLALATDELVAGSVQPLDAWPAEVAVSVGAPGVYTITSRGDTDLRARLIDADGRVVAASDDRPDDWNFQLSPRLLPGRYTLQVDRVKAAPVSRGLRVPVPTFAPAPYSAPSSDTGGGGEEDGGGGATDTGTASETHDTGTAEEEPSYDEEPSYADEPEPSYDQPEDAVEDDTFVRGRVGSTVEMRAPTEVAGPALGSSPVELRPGDQAIVGAVDAKGADVVVARAHSGENVGVAIEVRDGAGWRPLADGTGHDAVAVARVHDATVRVRVWSEDLRGGPVEVRVETPRANGAGSDALANGVGGGGTNAVLAQGGAGQFVIGPDRGGLYACAAVNEGCPPVTTPTVGGGEDGLVLVRIGGPVVARRVSLAAGEPVAVRLGDRREHVGVGSDGGVTVVAVRAPAGSPNLRLAGGSTAVVDGAAIAVSYGAASEALVWDGSADPSELDAKVERSRVGAAEKRPASAGRSTVQLPAHGAVLLQLGGLWSAQVALDEGLIATFGARGAAWAQPGAISVRLAAVGGELGLVNPTDQPRIAVVDLLPSPIPAPAPPPKGKRGGAATPAPAGPTAELVVGHPFEQLETEAVTRLIPVRSAGTLRLRGSATGRFVGEDGRVLPADGAAVNGAGTLVLEARPGPVLAWVEEGGEPGPLAVVLGRAPIELADGGVAPLSGAAQRVLITAGAGQVATLTVPCPAVAEVRIPGGFDRIEVLGAGDRLDLVTPQGSADVLVRALTGAALYGDAIVAVQGIAPIAEGLGPETLLGPGQAAFYSFQVDREGPVGVGVRADSGRVEARLLDATGKPRVSGVVAMDRLEPGRWILEVAQPAGAPPARARPAVAGLVPPSTLPPEDVVRTYVQLAKQER